MLKNKKILSAFLALTIMTSISVNNSFAQNKAENNITAQENILDKKEKDTKIENKENKEEKLQENKDLILKDKKEDKKEVKTTKKANKNKVVKTYDEGIDFPLIALIVSGIGLILFAIIFYLKKRKK